ncbi:ribonuclease domain-containing protein [Streptomyces armeniacus]|uniref:ribonuclease domain-containing protein n=1 Tax=Streptomyces armeniacus TaxID=83291 RepID=UPI003CCC840D
MRNRGYYREYAVTAPGSDSRGTGRHVAGEGGGCDERSYLSDHYETFKAVVQS